MCSQVSAASVKLAWDRNPENNIAGYEVSYGTVSGIYPNSIDAGNNTSATLSNLDQGTNYFFVVVARNKAGMLGPRSAEVIHTPGGRAPLPPNGTITSPDETVTIEAGERVSFSGEGSDPNGKTPLTYRWDFGSTSGIPDSTAGNPGNRKFNEPGTYKVTFTVKNSLGATDPSPAVRTIIVKRPAAEPIPRKNWKLKYVDSQEAVGYAATNAFDGNAGTFWHTQFSLPTVSTKPHEIQIDLGKANWVSGFDYLSRQDGISVGNIGRYQFYVSSDGKNWGKPVAAGTFDSSAAQKEVYFKPKKGRYIRLRGITEVNGYTHSNIAELQVLRAVKVKSKSPSASAISHAVAPASPASSANTGAVGGSTNTGAALSTPPTITTEVIDGEKFLSLTVIKPLVPDGVKRTVQVSPDLLDWFSGSKHTTVVTDNESVLKVRDNTPVTRHEKRFIRLKETPR